MSLTGPEYMWIMSSIVLCKFQSETSLTLFKSYIFYLQLHTAVGLSQK